MLTRLLVNSFFLKCELIPSIFKCGPDNFHSFNLKSYNAKHANQNNQLPILWQNPLYLTLLQKGAMRKHNPHIFNDKFYSAIV